MKVVVVGPLVAALLIVACGSAAPADDTGPGPAALTLRYASPNDADGALVIERDAGGRIPR